MAVILVVDDELLNRELIRAYFEGTEHMLVEASSAEQALEVVRDEQPDLVLLDVLMPGRSGFDVIGELKALSERFLPVVLVTALSDYDSRRHGLQCGADDYLTKPVDGQILLLRVRNLLALRTHQAALLERNAQLEELQQFKEEMSSLLVHDLKNPLAAIVGCLEHIRYHRPGWSADLGETVQDAHESAGRLLGLLVQITDLRRLESGRLVLDQTELDLRRTLLQLVQPRRWQAHAHGIQLGVEIGLRLPSVVADAGLLGRTLENLLDNALRHTPNGGRILVSAELEAEGVRVEVGNTGAGITEEKRAGLFKKYEQAEATGRLNQGLGLYFCRLAVEAHGGRIWSEVRDELPVVFCFWLPLESARAQVVG